MVTHTLTKMANGGIYDHLGGGFHRYSVDAKWLVPHFEKMLYDNAQLVRITRKHSHVTREPLFKTVVDRNVRLICSVRCSTERRVLFDPGRRQRRRRRKIFRLDAGRGQSDARRRGRRDFLPYLRCQRGTVTLKAKTFSIRFLHSSRRASFSVKIHEIEALIAKSKQKLFVEREKRIKPFRDEKIITAWNGLMLSGLAEAIKISTQTAYIDAAKRTVEVHFQRNISRRILAAHL